ncbi:MAG: helix-turn-helix transcriptional regulator [Bacteroidota bacterium]
MPKDRLLSLSKRLRALREKSGLTQEELARKAGVSVKYLQNLEGANPKNPSLLTLEKLARGLDKEIAQLIE